MFKSLTAFPKFFNFSLIVGLKASEESLNIYPSMMSTNLPLLIKKPKAPEQARKPISFMFKRFSRSRVNE